MTDEEVARCNTTALGQATFNALGLPVLDGSRAACHWGSDPDAAAPGILGPARMPSLFRDDYVTNSNDSYWLSNPERPLEGYDRIIGDERTERSLRTRTGLRIVADQLAQGPFTRRMLQDAVFSNRSLAGELMRDDLVAACKPDLKAACDVLAAWDLHENLDSKGAVLFRRFVSRLLGSGAPPAGIWRTPFDANDPVNTPRDLNTEDPRVEAALRGAVSDVDGLGKGLAVTLRQVQFEKRGDEKIPIHGGPGDPEGDFNAINVPWVAGEGYPDVPHGSSFVMAAHMDGSEVPRPAHDPHLLAVDEPVVAVLRRPDAHVLQEGVGGPGLLRARDPRRPQPDDPALREGALHEPAGDHLPAAAAQARADQARAGDGQRQAGEGPQGRAARRARLAAGTPEGPLPDPRDRQDHAQAHDQARPARPDLREARREGPRPPVGFAP